MKTSATFSILFWINTSRTKENLAELFARITVNQKRVNLSLKRRVDINSWNKYKSRVKPKAPNAALTNRYLDQVQNQLFQCYQDLKAENRLITPQAVSFPFLGQY